MGLAWDTFSPHRQFSLVSVSNQCGDNSMLLFKRKFLDAIRSGDKTQTIRLWKHRMMRSGQRSYIPGIGPIRITSVEQVEVESLTDADAVPDGFPSAAALRKELRTIYGDRLKNGHQAYRVVFHRVEV
jgi:hypothetical protein